MCCSLNQAREKAPPLNELADDYLGIHLRMEKVRIAREKADEEARIAREEARIAREEARIAREKAKFVSELFSLVSSDSNVGGLKDQVLENGVDVNVQCDDTGNTMLHIAVKV